MITCRAHRGSCLTFRHSESVRRTRPWSGLNSRPPVRWHPVFMFGCGCLPVAWLSSVLIDLRLSASFLTALACRLCVPACRLCARRGANLRSLPFGRNNDVQRDVRILTPQWANRNKMLLGKNFEPRFQSHTHTLMTPQGAVLRQGPTARVLVQRAPVSISRRVLCMFLDYGAKRQLSCC